jgi:hypothetical protein
MLVLENSVVFIAKPKEFFRYLMCSIVNNCEPAIHFNLVVYFIIYVCRKKFEFCSAGASDLNVFTDFEQVLTRFQHGSEVESG